MRRTISTLGIVGLGIMTATVSANAAPPAEDKKITICHATSSSTNPFVVETISLSALNGHTGPKHTPLDIIPKNYGDIMPQGQNLTAANLAILANNCAVLVVPPVVDTPDPDPEVTPDPDPEVTPDPDPEVTPDPDPEVTPDPDPEVTPDPDPEVTPDPDPEVETPEAEVTEETVVPSSAAPVAAPKAAAAVAKKTNVGYNVQTAVRQTSDAGIPVWLMALTGALTAGAATVVWQSGRHARSTEN